MRNYRNIARNIYRPRCITSIDSYAQCCSASADKRDSFYRPVLLCCFIYTILTIFAPDFPRNSVSL